MKKILSILILGILVLSGLGATAFTNEKSNNEDTFEKSITFSEPEIIDEGEFVSISLEEETSCILEVGKPKIPVVTQVFNFPFGTKINCVDVSFSNENSMVLSKEIKPAPEPVPINSQSNVLKNQVKDSKTYDSKELFPKNNLNRKEKILKK